MTNPDRTDSPRAQGEAGRSWLYHPDFPKHWKRQPLYAFAKWVNGLAFRDIQFSATGRPVVKIAEIKDGISGQTKFTDQEFDESVRIRSGDLLFSWSGQPETSIDVFWWRGPEGWLNQHIFRVTTSAAIDTTFFYYILRYLRPNFVAIARNKQTTGLGHVTKHDLERIEAAYPSLPEQRAIARVLGSIDDKIELNRRMNETLEAIASAIFKSWFIDFDPVRAKSAARQAVSMNAETAALFPSSSVDSLLGKTPKGWRVAALPEAVEINPLRSLAKDEMTTYLDMQNMPTRGHRVLGWTQRPFVSGSKFTNGDTLVARITPCLENGKTAFVDFLPDREIGWGSTEFIVLRPKEPLPEEYAYCLARHEEFRTHAIQNMTGSSGRQRVATSCFQQYLVTVPPKAVALAFGQIVQPLFAKAKANSQESTTLAAIRDALLPKLISGEIRIKDAEKTVGEKV